MELALRALVASLVEQDPATMSRDRFLQIKREFSRDHQLKEVPSNAQLVRIYHSMLHNEELEANEALEKLLRKRWVRSESGVVSVQVLTKPYWCPGKCIFCPNDFTMPKSYINTEPGAMRALLNNFDPVKQVYNRLLSLTMTGHKVDKIEMIVLGGTWDVYPQEYKEWFVKSLYDACNTFGQFYEYVRKLPQQAKKFAHAVEGRENPIFPEKIEESEYINESANCRIIGLTIETRPEYVTDENCQFWRRLGVTRMEMGLQSLYDDVLDANKRGHSVQQAREAVHKLRQYGFKMSLHMMPGLYTSTITKDISSFRLLYEDHYFRPDEIKFYPTSVIPNTELYDLYISRDYTPLTTQEIKQIIREVFLRIIPPYTRIKRLIRDIPATEIVAWSNITNLSQLTHDELRRQWKNNPEVQELYARLYGNNVHVLQYDNIQEFLYWKKDARQDGDTIVIGQQPDVTSFREFVSLDTRSREVRHKKHVHTSNEVLNTVVRRYRSSVGWECFVSVEDIYWYLYGLVRVLLPDVGELVDYLGLGDKTAVVRELHVYGNVQSLQQWKTTDTSSWVAQHKGLWSQLMDMAEKIVQGQGYSRLSVIAGVWVKPYYRKLGYVDEGTYVVKYFS